MPPEYTEREKALLTMLGEVEQILGKALGYPKYTADMFENGVADGTVCVGDHTAVTLAMEAAAKIRVWNY